MRLTALTSAAVLAVALIAPAPAYAAPTPDPALGMQQALQRDLGLTADQARVRQAHEAAAPVVERDVRARLGSRFAGAWYSPDDGRLKVGVLDEVAAAQARAAGALPVRVDRSERQLDAVKARLDGKAAAAPRRARLVCRRRRQHRHRERGDPGRRGPVHPG
ncbi:hypothetical protein [Catellatospora paridis]|uniref:hypothetical protein n=1 Tax=Catellatospora paridis TaxID=1617086 RepID=UPI0018AF7D83|nr:hypothetical protein [Catellatospora paridis]